MFGYRVMSVAFLCLVRNWRKRKMIIDAHVHLPIGKDCSILCRKREKLLHELDRNHIDKCIVISDSCMKSDIGNLDECVELFRESVNVNVVGGISPYLEFQTQLRKIKDYLDKNLIVGIKLYTGHEAFYLSDERLKEVYELAQQYDVPVLFHSGWDNYQYSDVNVVAERVLFGSDYSGCSQEEHIQFVKNLRLNKILTEAVFAENAKCVFRLKV